ncbi:MAG TPA: class I SAM-dependent methyltransferase [Dysgonomonas sp.]|nr:class I SAM-dependent methyltransferase [Dysgonomonas sp.]
MQPSDYYSYERKELYPFMPAEIKCSLDVGCAKGVFSEKLKQEKGTETWGIEMVDGIAEIAETKLHRVLKGPFDAVYQQLPEKYFDCIFFNDVLEHMAYPDECLHQVKSKIAPGGRIIASLPNIRHIRVMIDLVWKGDWEYQESGIMDRTHLRFFTRKSIIRMFDKCGYNISRIEGVNPISPTCLTSIINKLLFNRIDDIRYSQFVVVAQPK